MLWAVAIGAVGSLFGPLVVHFGQRPVVTFFARLWAGVLLAFCVISVCAGAGEMTLPLIGFAAVQVVTLWPRKREPGPAPVSF